MTDSSTEDQPQADDAAGITDEQLPEDLRPSEENPLAQPLDDDEAPDDLDVHRREARRAVGRRAARGLSDVIGHRPVRRVIRVRARAAT